MKYVIEHLDEELEQWSMWEYENISVTVGKGNLIFSNMHNIKNKENVEKLKQLGTTTQEPVNEMQQVNLKRACLLDPSAEKTLCPDDAENFDFLIFGGILGDNPPQKRTEKLLSPRLPGIEKRNLGDMQMSTDNAVKCAKLIVEDKIPFEEIKFIDNYELKITEKESVVLPYRYLFEDNKPFMHKKLLEYLKEHPFF
jgi:ribosome biogenesis SPOUT family RNA methylase Rps3